MDSGVGSRLAAQAVDLWVYPEAWPWPPAGPLLAQKSWIVPIPGTAKLHRLKENPGAVNLERTGGDLAEIGRAAAEIQVEGERYPAYRLATTGR